MMKPLPLRRRPRPSQEGYILVAVIFMLAILILAMAIAAPNIKKQVERDRDLETMHRGKQFVRAIRLYYKKFNKYPINVDALVNTNNMRFLRKKYKDPTTGKDEWRSIRMGQNKLPTVYGFFGKPLASGMMGGMGTSCGANGLNSSGFGSSGFGSSGFGSSSMGSSSFGSSGMGSSGFGSSSLGSSSMGSSSFGSSGLGASTGLGSNSPIGGCPTD